MSTSSVRNLGAWFDKNIPLNAHVGKVCSKAFFGLCNIREIRKFLSDDVTKTLVHAFVTPHVDYWNPPPPPLCFTECQTTNLTVYRVSLMPQRASSAISHGILISLLRCSNSTGFLFPRGSDLKSSRWFTKRLKAADLH